jgi:hypothetical protein
MSHAPRRIRQQSRGTRGGSDLNLGPPDAAVCWVGCGGPCPPLGSNAVVGGPPGPRRPLAAAGVRARDRRRHWYGAQDLPPQRRDTTLQAVDLGALRAVHPPVGVGFGSVPSRPSLVHLTTMIEAVCPELAATLHELSRPRATSGRGRLRRCSEVTVVAHIDIHQGNLLGLQEDSDHLFLPWIEGSSPCHLASRSSRDTVSAAVMGQFDPEDSVCGGQRRSAARQLASPSTERQVHPAAQLLTVGPRRPRVRSTATAPLERRERARTPSRSPRHGSSRARSSADASPPNPSAPRQGPRPASRRSSAPQAGWTPATARRS